MALAFRGGGPLRQIFKSFIRKAPQSLVTPAIPAIFGQENRIVNIRIFLTCDFSRGLRGFVANGKRVKRKNQNEEKQTLKAFPVP